MKYIGIDIGGTNLKAGLVDGEGQLLATRKMKVAGIADPAGHGPSTRWCWTCAGTMAAI